VKDRRTFAKAIGAALTLVPLVGEARAVRVRHEICESSYVA
jgi:hypothetical protein